MTTKTKETTGKKKFNLGSENVLKTFLYILIPTIIAQIIGGTFVVFDTFFVSHGFHAGRVFEGIGDGSLFNPSAYSALGPAAISYAVPYTFFLIGIGLAIGAGLSSLIIKHNSRNELIESKKAFNSFAPMSVILGTCLMIFLLIFSKVLVWFGSGFQKDYLDSWFNNPLMNKNWTPDSYECVNGHILQQSSWYLRIQAIGSIPYVYMTAGVIMLRVQGKAHYATSFSSVGLFVNILFDFLFIIVLKMNAVGAAMATVMSQLATASIYYYFFSKKAEVRTDKFDWANSKKILKSTLSSGTSIMMLQVLSGTILILFTFFIGVANYGEMYNVTNYSSVYQVYNSMFIFFNLITIGIVQSIKPILDYNYQNKNYKLLKKSRNIGFIFSITFAIIVELLVYIFARELVGIFYSVNGESVDYISSGFAHNHGFSKDINIFTDGMAIAEKIIRILFITFPIATVILISSSYLQALERDKFSSIILFGKVGIVFVLLIIFGFAGPSLIEGNWNFYDNPISQGGKIIDELNKYKEARLGLFLALPVADLIIFIILLSFFIKTEIDMSKVIKESKKNNLKKASK